MISLVDRHLLKTYLKFFGTALFILSFIFLLVDALSAMSKFDASLKVFAAYYFNYFPWIVSQMFPIAALMGTVFLFVSLQRNLELVVFNSLGISVGRILSPVLILIFVLSLFALFVNDFVVPKSMDKRNFYYHVKMRNRPESYNKLKKENVWFKTPKAIINFGKVLSEDTVERVRVYFVHPEKWEPKRVLESRILKLTGQEWIYKDGVETLYDGEAVQSRNFDILRGESLEDFKEFKQRQSALNSMSLSQLALSIKKAKEASMSTKVLATEFHSKLSFIFSALFLSLLALPFCLGHPRSSNVFVGFGMSLLIVVVYWILFSTGITMGKSGALNPLLAGWLLPFLSLLFSLFFLRKRIF